MPPCKLIHAYHLPVLKVAIISEGANTWTLYVAQARRFFDRGACVTRGKRDGAAAWRADG